MTQQPQLAPFMPGVASQSFAPGQGYVPGLSQAPGAANPGILQNLQGGDTTNLQQGMAQLQALTQQINQHHQQLQGMLQAHKSLRTSLGFGSNSPMMADQTGGQ